MNIKFEEKAESFDNVTFSWYITSSVNEYRVIIDFVGAINEDGEEDIVGSMCAEISVNEIKHHDHDTLEAIRQKISLIMGYDQNTFMVNAPDIRESLYLTNESSYSDTMDYFNLIMTGLASVLIDKETRADMDA